MVLKPKRSPACTWLEANLTIIPVVNKIDLPNAKVKSRLEEILTISADKAILVIANTEVAIG